MTKYSPNMTQCVEVLGSAIEEYISLKGKLDKAQSFWEISLNLTKQFSNTSDYTYICYDGFEDFILYQIAFYNEFEGVADLGTSFF